MAKPEPGTIDSQPATDSPSQAPGMLTALPVRPAVKQARLPEGARILSRRLLRNSRSPVYLTSQNPQLAHRRRIDVLPGTSLVSILKRVQKLLDKSPAALAAQKLGLPDSSKPKQQQRGPLSTGGQKKQRQPGKSQNDDPGQVSHKGERFDVLVVGTGGRNIEKALKAAAVFQRRGDCVVRLYTNTVGGIDVYEVEEEEEVREEEGVDADMGDDGQVRTDKDWDDGQQQGPKDGRTLGRTVRKERARKASSLEVAIRLKS